MTTDEMPLLEVMTTKSAAIQTRRSSFVACIGVWVVIVNCRRHSRSQHW